MTDAKKSFGPLSAVRTSRGVRGNIRKERFLNLVIKYQPSEQRADFAICLLFSYVQVIVG